MGSTGSEGVGVLGPPPTPPKGARGRLGPRRDTHQGIAPGPLVPRALVNGRIHVMDEPHHIEQALLEQDGRVALVGTNEEVRAAALALGAPVEDLDGRVVLPGFVDAHMHFLHVGVRRTRPDLAGAHNKAEALDRVRTWLHAHPGTGPVTAEGWDEAEWHGDAPPTRAELDGLTKRPLVLRRICGHKAVANSPALEAVRVRWSDPERVREDGVLLEEPSLFLNEVLPEDPALLDRALQVACQEAHRLGVTTVGDFEQAPLRAALVRGAASGSLTVRVSCSIYPQQLDAALAEGFRTGRIPTSHSVAGKSSAKPGGSGPSKQEPDQSRPVEYEPEDAAAEGETGGGALASKTYPEMPQSRAGGERVPIRTDSTLLRDGGMKVFLDGSIGGHTALLMQPYTDRPETRGTQIWSDEELDGLFEKAHAAGIQLLVHVIGDGAVEQGLQAFERLAKKVGVEAMRRLRHRFEHYEIVHDDQIQRTAALGITSCSQPNFVGVWSAKGGLYEERLGARFAANNRFQAFKKAGLRIAFGSDGMPFGPLVGIQAAVEHPDPEQRMTPQEAIWHYTHEAAWSLHREAEVGSLEPGRCADWVVLDQRDLEDPAKHWVIQQTVLDGQTQIRTV